MQQAREAARRTSCKNSLEQLGLALHNYHNSHRPLPPGYLYRPGPEGNHAGFGWGAMILPQLEQENVYREFDWNVPSFDAANVPPRERHLAVFLCPSDAVSDTGFVHMGPQPERYAMASYAANFGPPDLDENQEQRDALFSRTRMGDVQDGLSNTLMLGERMNGPFRSASRSAFRVRDDMGRRGPRIRRSNGRPRAHGPVPDGACAERADTDDRHVSAPHVGLAQFLLGTGSVRPINESIDLTVYRALGTRAGGEVIGEF